MLFLIAALQGFVGVVNRSQGDIEEGKPIEEALKTEQEYFAAHTAYRNIQKRLGTPYLTRTLNKV